MLDEMHQVSYLLLNSDSMSNKQLDSYSLFNV